MWGRVVKIALSVPFLIVAGLFGLYLVFGFFLVNPLAQKLLPWLKTRDEGPASAFHTELLERLTQRVKIEDAALTKLAEARGTAMRDELLRLGLDPARVSISAPGPQTLKDQLVGSKMNLAAGKHTVAEPPPVAPAGATGP